MSEALSAYDESVPGPPVDERLAARFARLREERGADPGALSLVRDLVLVVSSSRGGSTLLSELLRGPADLLTLPGEVNPYVVVAQLSPQGRRTALAGELAAELGRPAPEPLAPEEVRGFALQCAWRMTAQWPAAELPTEAVERAVHAVLARGDARPPHVDGGARFTAALLAELAPLAGGRVLDLRRYDVPGDPPPPGPTADVVVEMTPYRLLQPWLAATEADLAARTVVLATPRNSFRIEHLSALFPSARVRLLHLTRNPAGAVNGLIDGWLHPSFFNCRTNADLRIAGYSDRFPQWGRDWWKYDVPPSWRTVVSAPLARVAALQWSSAHEAVLAAMDRHDVHRLAYENLVGALSERERVATDLAAWLGLADPAGFVARVRRGLDPVMATAPPAPARWRARSHELADVLADPYLLDLAQRLGYPADPATWR